MTAISIELPNLKLANSPIPSDQIYSELITLHAYRWLKEQADLNIVEYLEFNGGALITNYCAIKGIETIANDLILKIEELIK